MDNTKEYILCAAILRKESHDCHRAYWPIYHDIYDCEVGYRHVDIAHRFEGTVSKHLRA